MSRTTRIGDKPNNTIPFELLCDCARFGVRVSDQRDNESDEVFNHRWLREVKRGYVDGADWNYDADCELCTRGQKHGYIMLPSHRKDENDFWYCMHEDVGLHGNLIAFSPRFVIGARTNQMHPKRALGLLQKWADRGWYDYGVNVDLGWVTEKGMKVLPRLP